MQAVLHIYSRGALRVRLAGVCVCARARTCVRACVRACVRVHAPMCPRTHVFAQMSVCIAVARALTWSLCAALPAPLLCLPAPIPSPPSPILSLPPSFSGYSPVLTRAGATAGMGTLAGSTVMLLSIAWGGSLMVGRCDLVNGRAKDKTLTKGWRPGGNMRLSRHTVMDMLSETGVTTDDTTRQNAYIMVATSLLYLFPQVPAFLGEEHDPQAALMGCVACFVVLAAYCAFQVVAPELQKRKMKMAQKAYMRRQALNMAHSIAGSAGAVLIDQNGNIRDVALKALFEKFDEDRSGSIDHVELRKMAKMFLMSGPAAVQTPQQAQQAIDLFMHEMDTDNDGHITYDEMKTGLERWFRDLRTEKDAVALALRYSQQCPASSDRQSQAAVLLDPEQQLVAAAGFEEEEEEDDEEDDEEEEELTPAQIKMKAAYKMLVGTLIVALVADPMVDAVAGLSTASGIPAFFVSFVITPFASNASELVSSLNFAKGKKVKNISLTYCQVYGAVAMNNTMCLGLFLMVVYARGLAWEFSSEVTTTMVAILALVRLRPYSLNLSESPREIERERARARARERDLKTADCPRPHTLENESPNDRAYIQWLLRYL